MKSLFKAILTQNEILLIKKNKNLTLSKRTTFKSTSSENDEFDFDAVNYSSRRFNGLEYETRTLATNETQETEAGQNFIL